MPRKTTSASKVAIRVIDGNEIKDIESVSQKEAIKRAKELATEQKKPVIFVEKVAGGLFIGAGRAPVETLLSGTAAGRIVEIDLVLGGLEAARKRERELIDSCKEKFEVMDHTEHVPATKEELEQLKKESNAMFPIDEKEFQFFAREFGGHSIVTRITVCEWTDETHELSAEITSKIVKDRLALHRRRAEVAAANWANGHGLLYPRRR